jgi:hypothetical protein
MSSLVRAKLLGCILYPPSQFVPEAPFNPLMNTNTLLSIEPAAGATSVRPLHLEPTTEGVPVFRLIDDDPPIQSLNETEHDVLNGSAGRRGFRGRECTVRRSELQRESLDRICCLLTRPAVFQRTHCAARPGAAIRYCDGDR